MLRKKTNGPLPWLFHPATIRWPMLVFDIWTLGNSALFGLFVMAPRENCALGAPWLCSRLAPLAPGAKRRGSSLRALGVNWRSGWQIPR